MVLYLRNQLVSLVPKIGIFRTPLRQLDNIGIIDSGYCRIMVPIDKTMRTSLNLNKDYFIGYASLKPISIEIEKLDDTERGSGGFGST